MIRTLLIGLLLLTASSAHAQQMLMTRVGLKADIAFEYLRTTLEEHGYSVAHIQTCNDGLADFGYKSDFYRVIFFGKGHEVRALSAKYPEIIPYLPLKVVIFAEKDETVLTVLNPLEIAHYFPQRELKVYFQRWHSDVESIFQDMRQAADLHEPPAPEFVPPPEG